MRFTTNSNLHYHFVFLEGVFVDRAAQGLQPRFLHADPPTDADIATVLQKISQRVIRHLRRLGYLEAGIDTAVATGYDPLGDDEPELARTMAASVQQRIAFGERAGQKVRRIGSGFGSEGESPILTGTRCASVHGFSLHANTHIPAHRRDQLERLIRYTARGAVSLERLEHDEGGDLLYTFTRVRHEVARRNERNGLAASSSTFFTRKEVHRWGSASEGALWCEQHTPERRSETRSRPSRGCA